MTEQLAFEPFCTHATTYRRADLNDRKYYCVECGKAVMDVDPRQCGDCASYTPDGFSRPTSGGEARLGYCRAHRMMVARTMNVTFNIEQGTCWRAKT